MTCHNLPYCTSDFTALVPRRLARSRLWEPYCPTTMMRLYDSATALSFIQRTQLIRISLAVWLPARYIGVRSGDRGHPWPVDRRQEGINAPGRCGWATHSRWSAIVIHASTASFDVMFNAGCTANTDYGGLLADFVLQST